MEGYKGVFSREGGRNVIDMVCIFAALCCD